ncbi:MAG TPA: CDP-alcohol phosphatidyltransferase family protein [Acetobacteraceae bacterium]|nr:CDP-alcohol phosphatidyltransferase family protein [Acetobacteraceae bacterium]
MIDRHMLPLLGRVYAAPARRLAAAGVSADAVTFSGFALGLLAALLIALEQPLAGLAALLANRVLDGLDGAVARLAGPTERGAFLDIALDFFVYAAIPFGFALADPGRNALAAAALLCAFMGTACSFLAYAVIAARRGLLSSAYPQKGIYYLGGLTEGAETITCLAVMCLAPAWFPALAWGFAALCLVTTVTRWWWGIRQFRGSED